MKKYFLLFLLFCAAAILYLSFPINSKAHFVSIEENKFKLNGNDFYPVAVNYLATLYTDGDELWAGPTTSYNIDTTYSISTKDSCLLALRADLTLIKQMGFNTVRIVGIGEEMPKDTTRFSELYIGACKGKNQFTEVALLNDDAYKKYFNALAGLFNEVNNAGLKIIFLLRTRPNVKSTEEHLKKIASYFKNDTSILAYDLFNEPLYFDVPSREKKEVHEITKRWNKFFKMYAPHQLFTIGLEGIREIFKWDPNILDVDFLSLHPYDFEPDQVMNEIYWYGHYIKKPWIIGETAIPADNDSVSYEDQKQFARKTLKQTYNCGASGYSWWQYKDVEWHAYRANFMGTVTRTGTTKIKKNNLIVKGMVKPVAEEFGKYNPANNYPGFSRNTDSCICLKNYYNYSEGNKCRIIGYLTDENNKPIQGGIVLAWNQGWNHSYHTVTKENGSFELLGTFPFYHWIATATLHDVVRGEISPDTAKINANGIPTLNMGTLKVNKLSF